MEYFSKLVNEMNPANVYSIVEEITSDLLSTLVEEKSNTKTFQILVGFIMTLLN